MDSKYNVLIITDDIEARVLIERALDTEEFRTLTVHRGQRGINDLVRDDFDIAFMSLPRASLNEDKLFKSLLKRSPPIPCIVIAGDQMEAEAASAMEQGAYDYVLSSSSAQRIRVACSRAINLRQATDELLKARAMLKHENFSAETLGGSPSMMKVKALIRKAASTGVNVIIEGEQGTGKRRTAKTIHNLSSIQEGPFVELSCDLVPESLVESEFFGRETGMYGYDSRVRPGKVEQADGGTIYLEDMDRLHPRLQTRLLHTLRSGEVERVGGTSVGQSHIRVIASSKGDLEASVYSGEFLKELFDELKSVHIKLPPLRSRRDDIPLLLGLFLEEFAGKLEKSTPRPNKAAIQRLLEYDWPGNIEELRDLSEGLSRLGDLMPITPADLPERIRIAGQVSGAERYDIMPLLSSLSLPDSGIMLPRIMDSIEGVLITKALDKAQGLQKEAARLLGLKRTTLLQKMKKKGIS